MWQHVKLSEQICPWDTLACCWDVMQPTNKQTLSSQVKTELYWWINNVETACNVMHQTQPDITLTSDASYIGWGCACGQAQSGGQWLPEEKEFHIDYFAWRKGVSYKLSCSLVLPRRQGHRWKLSWKRRAGLMKRHSQGFIRDTVAQLSVRK